MNDATSPESGTIQQPVYVYCPIGEQTGGPEALHQLVSTLRELGVDSYLVPTPSTLEATPVPAYDHYQCPIVNSIQDEAGICVVIPESELGLLAKFEHARTIIWWLSLDNSTVHELSMTMARAGLWSKEFIKVLVRHGRKLLAGQHVRRSELLARLRRAEHVAQSKYAMENIKRDFGIESGVLTDYTYANDRVPLSKEVPRKPIVVFNPAKGKKYVDTIDEISNLTLIPIAGLSPDEVQNLLQVASVYLDLGHHPGRDRLPREAAVCEAVVVVGSRGSAANFDDVPVPSEHKVEMSGDRRDIALRAISAIERVLSNREAGFNSQADFRKGILTEQDRFRSECRRVFASQDVDRKHP